ncbi:heme-dependent oxidative N-demethylase family protein [Sphingomonas sp. 22176]|uniref:heme-dependent oxidative N-demethylase family protein n=1 Tax=Sphingomonas sp. 22176 TaxID=3453884 RepID=UPI003F83BE2E
MSLGFSVEALIPRARGGGALRMGLVRVPEAAWLTPAADLTARAAVFAAEPDCVQVLPEAEAAVEEVAKLLPSSPARGGVAKRRRGEDAERVLAPLDRGNPSVGPSARHLPLQGRIDAIDGLRSAASRVWEDLCILTPDASGQYRLTAAALAFPTDWHLTEKLGHALTPIHAPIHGYAEQLAAGVDHFFTTLQPGPIFGRTNWFVVASDAWRYLPQDDPQLRFAHVTAENAGATLFVRCERQTLRRLPQSGAVLFTIGIHVEPLDRLSHGAVTRVAQSVAGIGSGEHERRAAPFYAEALTRYAERRNRSPELVA